MPWEVEHEHEDTSKHFKYQYHPKGDISQAPRNAPSALNTVIIPNVTLPKVSKFPEGSVSSGLTPVKALHDMFNKWGKDDY